MTATKTYFLAPGWNIPSSPTLLGSIIANPSQPDLALFTASPTNLTTTTTTTPINFTSPTSSSPQDAPPQTALFSLFLALHGLGDDEPAFTFDRKHIQGYSFRGQKSHVLAPPNQEFLRAAATDARVATLFANTVGAYLVTGVRSVRGAGVSVRSGKGRGWVVELGVGLREGAEVEEGKGESKGKSAEGEGSGEVVFAVEVKQVKVREGGEVVLEELDGGGEKLQARLDGEFGEGTFRVFEGVDEAAEGGERVQIVTASPTYVDMLTASTVKVGGEHGIWH